MLVFYHRIRNDGVRFGKRRKQRERLRAAAASATPPRELPSFQTEQSVVSPYVCTSLCKKKT
jgi:hypothetical protein